MKLKKDDRVSVKFFPSKLIGKSGKILFPDGDEINKRGFCLIEFDEYINGHDGLINEIKGKNGHCWWVPLGNDRQNNIQREVMRKMIFKMGDRVEVVKELDDYPGLLKKTGTIIGILADKLFQPQLSHYIDTIICVEFDDEIRQGHDGGEFMSNKGKPGHCLYIRAEYLEKKNSSIILEKMGLKREEIEEPKIIRRKFFDDLRKCYDSNKETIIVGETGTGKSFAVEYLAKEMDVPLTRVCFDISTSVRDLLGSLKLVGENGTTVTKFCKGAFLDALIRPGIILMDEPNAADPAKSFLLHQMIDMRKVYIKEEGEYYKIDPEVRLFGTINPSNRRYTGTLSMNLAMLNRFHIIYAEPFSEDEIQKILPDFEFKNDLILFYKEIRKLIEDHSPTFEFSIRNILRIIDLYKVGMSLTKAIEIGFLNQSLCFGDKENYDSCIQIAKTVFGLKFEK